MLTLRPAETCRWDAVALGEVMLRFDPGEGRVRTARSFQVWEGGGEYNVVRALSSAFGLRASVVTAFPESEVGRLAEGLIRAGGVDVSHVIWRAFDGLGRNTRVGLNFTERGFGVRPPLGVSDRACSAASQIAPGEVDWDDLFGREGVRWLHTGGIFAALGPQAPDVTLEAVQAAKRHGVTVSFDLNYRASLWSNLDVAATQAKLRAVASHVDVMFGDAAGLKACLGEDAPTDFPILATTERDASSATRNAWSATLRTGGEIYASARRDLEILDRVGGGDAFASGVIYALLQGLGPQAAVDYGAAHGALAMTTPGDWSMASLPEVEALIAGATGKVIR